MQPRVRDHRLPSRKRCKQAARGYLWGGCIRYVRSGDEPDHRFTPMNDARAALATELKRVREAAGLTTRQVTGFSSGHISSVETGRVLPSERLLRTYAVMGGRYPHLAGL